MTVTAKLKILPNIGDSHLLADTMHTYKIACNFVSEYIYRTRSLKHRKLHDALYRELRERFDLRSQMAQSVIKTVVARYKAALTSQGEWVKVRFQRPECDLVWNRDYSLKNDTFSVNTLNGRIKVRYATSGMERYLDGSWKFGTAKLITRHGKWYLHIPVSKDIPELQPEEVVHIVGVDLGINFLATAYDSTGKTTFFDGRAVKQKRAQYQETRKQLQKRQTPSARRRLKRIGSRENRWMSDMNHQISKALVSQNPKGTLFVLEDLTGIRTATERVALKNRYEQVSWAFYDLSRKVEYKAQLYGSKAIAVDPKHTSQTCPKCGHTHHLNRDKKTHMFTCRSCGYRSNDDRIGAMNLHRKGIEYLRAVTMEQALS